MSGLVGYIGPRDPARLLLAGLRALEHGGYDSAGLAVNAGSCLHIRRIAGRLDRLEQLLEDRPVNGGHCGIAHLRWATHGRPTDNNAHPHVDCSGEIAVVQKGIIENHAELRAELTALGHVFQSDTDTEVVSHLIESVYSGDLAAAVRQILPRLRGIFAFAVVSSREPHRIVAACNDRSLIIGLGDGESFIASDFPGVIPFTRRSYVMNSNEVADIRRDAIVITNLVGDHVAKEEVLIDWNTEQAEKGGYAHYMLKEIHEQPLAIRDTLAGRINPSGDDVVLAEVGLADDQVRSLRRVYFIGCGTAYHAGMVAATLAERLADLDARAEVASEFRYRDPRIDEHTLVVGISQSGETADTLAALKEARARGARTIGIVNTVGSAIAREVDDVFYTRAGAEISVASTKAYTTQLVAGALLAIYLGRRRGVVDAGEARRLLAGLQELPGLIAELLAGDHSRLQELASKLAGSDNTFYIGRGLDYAVALEGQLKLKEVTYIHAEACPAGELKHGTLALIDNGLPVIAVSTQPDLRPKALSNIQEIRARGGWVAAVVAADDEETPGQVDAVIKVPVTNPLLMPIPAAVPLQLLAYYAALARGTDVDRPRNLVKSVTVE